MKKLYILEILVILIVSPPVFAEKNTIQEEGGHHAESFLDDCGRTIVIEKSAQRIISLYSAHTENLYSLGLEDAIIGVGRADTFPPEVKKKRVYDYRSDPEKVIAASPDLVLIRPFIKKSSPNFVAALLNAGIPVLCLYPEKFEDFDPYIRRLARLTGKEAYAEKLLEQFHVSIAEIWDRSHRVEPKVRVYFESTARDYRTVALDSMAAKAIVFAGGINVASDARPLHKGTSIAPFGTERILEISADIDVYVAQEGRMNPGISPSDIIKRPGFHVIKAVQEGRVYCIDEKIVSSPTFRFSQGVRELARMFYPEKFNDRLPTKSY